MTRHRLDLFSLLSGLTLTTIAVIALVGISLDVAAWVGPVVLIGVGVVVLVSVLAAHRGRDTTETSTSDHEHERSAALAEARTEVDLVDRPGSTDRAGDD